MKKYEQEIGSLYKSRTSDTYYLVTDITSILPTHTVYFDQIDTGNNFMQELKAFLRDHQKVS